MLSLDKECSALADLRVCIANKEWLPDEQGFASFLQKIEAVDWPSMSLEAFREFFESNNLIIFFVNKMPAGIFYFTSESYTHSFLNILKDKSCLDLVQNLPPYDLLKTRIGRDFFQIYIHFLFINLPLDEAEKYRAYYIREAIRLVGLYKKSTNKERRREYSYVASIFMRRALSENPQYTRESEAHILTYNLAYSICTDPENTKCNDLLYMAQTLLGRNDIVDLLDAEGNNLLHLAAIHNPSGMGNLLAPMPDGTIAMRAFCLKNSSGDTPMHILVKNGDPHTAAIFHCATSSISADSLLAVTDRAGNTILVCAQAYLDGLGEAATAARKNAQETIHTLKLWTKPVAMAPPLAACPSITHTDAEHDALNNRRGETALVSGGADELLFENQPPVNKESSNSVFLYIDLAVSFLRYGFWVLIAYLQSQGRDSGPSRVAREDFKKHVTDKWDLLKNEGELREQVSPSPYTGGVVRDYRIASESIESSSELEQSIQPEWSISASGDQSPTNSSRL